MSDERIDIEINDKIASTIPTKLQAIAANADKGNASVLKLKAALASINDTPARKLKDATDATVSSLNKELDANKNVGASIDKNTASIDKEIAAQKRLSAVIDETIRKREAEKAAALSASGTIGPQFAGSKATTALQTAQMFGGGAAAEAGAIGAASKEIESASAAAEAVAVSRFASIKNAAAGAVASVGTGISGFANGFKGFFGSGGAKTIEDEGSAIAKLGAHAKGNSTAIRELFVLAREGGRGDFTRMAGSVSILAGALGLMETVLIPLVVVLAPAAAALKIFQMSFASEKKGELETYANSLGLTSKEMRKLGDETVGANGKLKEFNTVTITMGDAFHGLIATVKEGLSGLRSNANSQIQAMGINWTNVFGNVGTFFRLFIAGMTGLVQGFVVWASATISNMATIIGNAGIGVFNSVSLIIHGLVNTAIGGINLLIAGANHIPGVAIKPLEEWKGSINGVTDGMKALTHVDIAGTVTRGIVNADRAMTGFGQRLRSNTLQAAKDRLKEEADAIKNNRNPHKGPKGSDADPKTKADYLYEDNTKLDNELSRMHLLKDAREEQQRLDQIEEEYIKRRMPLTAAEIQGFKDKIHAIQDYKYVQAEMDKIYENVTGPARTYNAALKAAKELLDKAAISQADYTRETVLAKRAYEEATDPLFAMKEAMETATIAAGKYGVEAQRNTYYEQIRQAELKKGIVISQEYVAGQNAEVDALMKKNNALLQSQYIQSQVGSVVDPMLQDRQFIQGKAAMYAEIDRLRANEVIKEEEAARAKHAILAKFDQLRLQGASAMFGELAQLSSSKNKQLAAIGKAAAVAQATIDGFLAVQKALSSAPPPWNIGLAAATAAVTGANVAAILSTNVGNFASGGQFMVEGQAGVDKNNISMNVSRGERVTIETPQQQRNRDGGGSAPNVHVPVTIVNVDDPNKVFDHMSTEDGKRVIFNHLRDNPSELKHLVNSAG